ncbi:MAG: hypothetical protein KME15_17220 [Drouetiella hepatica Uher 2000/2452]|jgi:hypothetical protein|uniref:Uncharacterized protein n=1 Tax=Drouetiella hepatica Uher 2000/2452 TaxID=904376 RepID=A0A951QCV3_9CYAN|nr:hypothetical protein [Drouetiella hepatica Uher 2000/2452]
MPRLVGKPSNGGAYVALLLLAAVGIAGVAEYTGVINEVPGFGSDYVGVPAITDGASPELPSSPSAEGQPDATTSGSPNAVQ